MNKKNISLRRKIAVPLALLVIIQNLMFLSGIMLTGVFDKLDSEAYRVLNEQVRIRCTELNRAMSKLTSSTQTASKTLSSKFQGIYNDHNFIYDSISKDEDSISKDVLNKMILEGTDQLIQLTYKELITGAFLVLNSNNTDNIYDGVYIRDLSPELSLDNNSDLLIEIGPKELSKQLNITLDMQWNPKYDFSEQHNIDNKFFDDSFYTKPNDYASKYTQRSMSDLGYWSKPFKLNSNDVENITYSVPIILEHNKILGVIGIELSTEYVSKEIPSDEISYSNGFYVMGEINKGILNKDWFISNGLSAKKILSEDTKSIQFETTGYVGNNNMFAAVCELEMYSENTVYNISDWTLAGVVPTHSLQKSSNSLKTALLISSLLALVTAVIIITLLGYYITKPIEKLAEEAGRLDPDYQIIFSRTNTTELDYLISALEDMNEKVISSSNRMSKIIKAMNLPIGCFEVNVKRDQVFLTDSLFGILEIEKDFSEQKFISLSQWQSIIKTLLENIAEDRKDCYKWYSKDNKTVHWLNMKFIKEQERNIGIIMDISDDILKQQILEYERDHDTLTQLLNRRIFTEKCGKTILKAPEKIGMLIFCDLDYLKYVNDTYGHSYGDTYIKAAADVFNKFSEYGGIVARISGDEFTIYLHGYDSESKARDILNIVLDETANSSIQLPNGNFQKICASKGYSWYPKDSKSVEELIKYADFAMYEIKKSIKDGIKEFDIKTYVKKQQESD